jgi:2-methylcitrate dehydratase PrpD
LDDAATFDLASKIEVRTVPNSDAAAFVPQALIVTLATGQRFETAINELPGTPRRPLTREQQLAKFRGCVAFGFGEGSETPADRLIAEIDRLDSLADAAILARLASKGADG